MNMVTPVVSAPKRTAFLDNAFGEIPEDAKFNPAKIVHVILTIDTTDPTQLRFSLAYPYDDPPDPRLTSIEHYAGEVAKAHPLILAVKNPVSPYDVGVSEQCWVMVQLDPKLKNWQFTNGEFGCTTKAEANDHNCNLRHVYPNGDVSKPLERVQRDGCRVLYLGVAKRDKPDPSNSALGSEFFNFHVEFIQQTPGAPERRLKVIFDPDIKNEGNHSIPP